MATDIGPGNSQLGLNAPDSLSFSSKKLAFDTELQTKAVLDDIYAPDLSQGLYDQDKKNMSAAKMQMKVSAMARGAYSMTITMKLPLSEDGPVAGNQLIGTEEAVRTLNTQIFRNDCRKAIVVPGYGVLREDAEYLNLWEKHIDSLADWKKERDGMEVRQAYVLGHGQTLTNGVAGAVLPVAINPNVFVCGISLKNQDNLVWSSNANTWASNIVDQIYAAGSSNLAPTKSQTLGQTNLTALEIWAKANARMIVPLAIPGLPGGWGWILTIDSRQAAFLGDPAWSLANLGQLYLGQVRLSEEVQKWPGVCGSYKHILFVEDERLPVLLPSRTSASTGSLTAQFVAPGNVDNRSYDNANSRCCCILHGKASQWFWEATKPTFRKQFDDYEAVQGTGIECSRGYGIPIYQGDTNATDTGYDTGMVQNGSALVLAGNPDYVMSTN